MRTHFEKEPVRVLMHLNGGYTKVSLERMEGKGLANGGIEWDIPTEKIPFPLRNIGSRFLLHAVLCSREDSIETLRAKDAQIEITDQSNL